jgi:hypothetical protein
MTSDDCRGRLSDHPRPANVYDLKTGQRGKKKGFRGRAHQARQRDENRRSRR